MEGCCYDHLSSFLFFSFLTVVPRLLNSCVNGAILMALLQNLTPRAFQSAKSSLRHKWECDYATNHSDSRTVITTRRAGLARWKLPSSSEGGGTVTPTAMNRTLALKTRIVPNFPRNFVKCQHLCWDFGRSNIIQNMLQPSRLPVVMYPLKLTMQYSTTIQWCMLKSS